MGVIFIGDNEFVVLVLVLVLVLAVVPPNVRYPPSRVKQSENASLSIIPSLHKADIIDVFGCINSPNIPSAYCLRNNPLLDV